MILKTPTSSKPIIYKLALNNLDFWITPILKTSYPNLRIVLPQNWTEIAIQK